MNINKALTKNNGTEMSLNDFVMLIHKPAWVHSHSHIFSSSYTSLKLDSNNSVRNQISLGFSSTISIRESYIIACRIKFQHCVGSMDSLVAIGGDVSIWNALSFGYVKILRDDKELDSDNLLEVLPYRFQILCV